MKAKRFGKKQAVLAVMVLLLGAAVYLNYHVAEHTPLTAGSDTTVQESETTNTTKALGESQFVSNTTAATDYFTEVRADREATREEALALVQETLADVKLDDATKRTMMETAAAVAAAMDQENAVESLIKAKGYSDSVVFIEQDRCHVVVRATELTEAQTLQIAQIVMAQTAVPAANINILAVP